MKNNRPSPRPKAHSILFNKAKHLPYRRMNYQAIKSSILLFMNVLCLIEVGFHPIRSVRSYMREGTKGSDLGTIQAEAAPPAVS